ncbi:hypothetical protein [Pelosinus propionicus]|uniref:Uncharacterized protein n=1 Tax=Pelosinus propionicus DSM 13327 TaxID=1123291 RepID=A0A1I4LSH4_9FIRM|nr:hypothetical protein [Pelosinus propionicus]SFL93763.1 hypothetical protein SAMN04490355_102668 [Pelosinus propionicus DSM 13327]
MIRQSESKPEAKQIGSELSDDKQQKLYQELKRSGQVENPVKYTQTHLEGGEADRDTE